jgi:hypothetical protein
MAAMFGAMPLAIGFGPELGRPFALTIGGLLVSQPADPLYDTRHLSHLGQLRLRVRPPGRIRQPRRADQAEPGE